MDPVYGYQYSPYQISSNPLVNNAYGYVNQALGLEGPNMAAGWRPQDVAFAGIVGTENLKYAQQQMYNSVDPVFDAMKRSGVGGSVIDLARKNFGSSAAAYISGNEMVQQAMGGNVDLYTRKIVAGATGMIDNPFPITSLGHQNQFHRQALEASSYFGASVLSDIYRKGDGTPDRSVTRGFKVEEIADITNQLGRSGKIDLTRLAKGIADDDPELRDSESNRNKLVLKKRLDTLASARDVFGAKSANELSQDIEGLLGVGADADGNAGNMLKKLSALATSLKKDVSSMVESRKVIAGALKEMERQADPTGQLAGVGGGSRFGATEARAMAIGDVVDIATFNIKDERQRAQASSDVTQMMVQGSQSSAGKLSQLMRYAEASGNAPKGLMREYAAAVESGDHGAAMQIAKRIAKTSGLGDVEAIIRDDRLFTNAVSHLQGETLEKYGQERGTALLTAAEKDHTNDVHFGMVREGDIRTQKARFGSMNAEIRDLERRTGLKLPKETAEESASNFKRNAIKAAEQEFADRMKGVRTDEERATLEQQRDNAIKSINALGGSTRDMQDQLMSGDVIGISGEVGSKITRNAAEMTLQGKLERTRKLAEGSETNDLKMRKLSSLMGKSDESRDMISKIKAAKTPEEKARLIKQMEDKAFEGKDPDLREQYDKEIAEVAQEIKTSQTPGSSGRPTLEEQAKMGGYKDKAAQKVLKDSIGREPQLKPGVENVIKEQDAVRKGVEQNPEGMEKIMSALQAALQKGIKEGMEKAEIKIDKPVKIDNTDAIKVEIVNISSLAPTAKE